MADKAKDNGPYTLYGRRTPNEAEVRVGSHDRLEGAKEEADDMVDTGIWHQANVRDRNDQTVHVGGKEDRSDTQAGRLDPVGPE